MQFYSQHWNEISDYAHYTFYFTNIKMKYLATLTSLFFFADYTHYAVLLYLLLKWNGWL